jgi:hypothetical protein
LFFNTLSKVQGRYQNRGENSVTTKRTLVFFIAIALCAGFTVPPSASGQSTPLPGSAGSPAVFFTEKVFEFQPVVDGVKVVHDFVVMNKGTTLLLIENVRTG